MFYYSDHCSQMRHLGTPFIRIGCKINGTLICNMTIQIDLRCIGLNVHMFKTTVVRLVLDCQKTNLNYICFKTNLYQGGRWQQPSFLPRVKLTLVFSVCCVLCTFFFPSKKGCMRISTSYEAEGCKSFNSNDFRGPLSFSSEKEKFAMNYSDGFLLTKKISGANYWPIWNFF